MAHARWISLSTGCAPEGSRTFQEALYFRVDSAQATGNRRKMAQAEISPGALPRQELPQALNAVGSLVGLGEEELEKDTEKEK